jgi:hypothetical protein
MFHPDADVSPAIRRLGVAIGRWSGDASPTAARGAVADGRGKAAANGHMNVGEPLITEIADTALCDAGLTAVAVSQQVEADGTIIYLASGVDEPRMIADLIRHIGAYTARANMTRPPGDRIRVRIAFDQGLAMLTGGRFVGDVIDTLDALCTGRLRPPGAGEGADGVVVVSPQIYREVVSHSWWGLPKSDFQPVTIVAPDGTEAPAWLDALAP